MTPKFCGYAVGKGSCWRTRAVLFNVALLTLYPLRHHCSYRCNSWTTVCMLDWRQDVPQRSNLHYWKHPIFLSAMVSCTYAVAGALSISSLLLYHNTYSQCVHYPHHLGLRVHAELKLYTHCVHIVFLRHNELYSIIPNNMGIAGSKL